MASWHTNLPQDNTACVQDFQNQLNHMERTYQQQLKQQHQMIQTVQEQCHQTQLSFTELVRCVEFALALQLQMLIQMRCKSHDVDVALPFCPWKGGSFLLNVHRCGRTGRGGKHGQALSFCSSGEKELLEEIEKYTGDTIDRYEMDKHDYLSIVKDSDDGSNNWKSLIDQANAEDGTEDEW